MSIIGILGVLTYLISSYYVGKKLDGEFADGVERHFIYLGIGTIAWLVVIGIFLICGAFYFGAIEIFN